MGTPGHTLRFRIYEVLADDGPRIGSLLGELTKVWGKTIRREYNNLGAGAFSINRHEDQAAWCVIDSSAPKRYVKAYLDDFSGPPVFGFFLTTAEVIAVSEDEEGGETVQIGGPGPMSILRQAVVHPNELRPGVSGEWASSATATWEWTNVAVGGPLIRQIEEAQERGAFPDVSVDFTRTHDSDGAAWDMTFDFSVAVGTDLWELVGALQKGGLIVDMDPDDFTLHAHKAFGTDRSDDVHFVYGVNIRGDDTGSKNIEAEGGASWALVQGRTIANGASTFVTVDEVVARGIGHVETFGQHDNTARVSFLTRFGHRLIREAMNRYDGTATIGVVEVIDELGNRFPSPYDQVALVDYFPGDTVFLDIPGVYDEQSPQVVAITLVETEGGEYDPIIELAYIDVSDGPGTPTEPPPGPWVPCPPTPPTGEAPELVQHKIVRAAGGTIQFDAQVPIGDTVVLVCWKWNVNTFTGVPPIGFAEACHAVLPEHADTDHNPAGWVAIYYKVMEAGDGDPGHERQYFSTTSGEADAIDGYHLRRALSLADTASVDDVNATTDLSTGGALTPGDGVPAFAVGGTLQYNGLVAVANAPDSGVTESVDGSSSADTVDFRWAWSGYVLATSASSAEIGATSDGAFRNAGAAAAFVDAGAGDTPDTTCPPPVPGQPFGPMELAVTSCDQVDFQLGAPDGTPIPYQLNRFHVKVRIGADLTEVLYIPTDPATGKFRLLASPCANVPTDAVFLTGFDAVAGEWKLLFSSEGEALVGSVPGGSAALPTLIVEGVTGSGTGTPSGPPVEPSAPPATAPSLVTHWYSGSPGVGSDQSAAILAFLRTAAPDRTLGMHPGVYRGDRIAASDLEDLALVATGVTIRRVDTSALGNSIFSIRGGRRIAIYDLLVEGPATSSDVASVGPTFPRQDEHAIELVDVHGFTLSGVWGRKVFGDGLYYARKGGEGPETLCEDGLVVDSVFSTCGRNGVSHISGRRIELRRVDTSDTSLHGIDVEGNESDDVCDDFTIAGGSDADFGRGTASHGLTGYAVQVTPGFSGVVPRRVLLAGRSMDVGQIKVTGPSSGTPAEDITVRDNSATTPGTSVVAHVDDWIQTNNPGLSLPASGDIT